MLVCIFTLQSIPGKPYRLNFSLNFIRYKAFLSQGSPRHHLCISVLRSPSWLKRGLFGLLVLCLAPVSIKFLLDLIQHFVYTHRGKYIPFSLCQKHCKPLGGQHKFSCLQSGCCSLMTWANLLISPLITQSTCTWHQKRGSLLGFGKLLV